MKVRRKSEIAEAVQLQNGMWEVTDLDARLRIMTPKKFAAHYEPVPCSACGDGDVNLEHHTHAVSEEQPAPNTIKTGFETVEQIKAASVLIPAPHRATIAQQKEVDDLSSLIYRESKTLSYNESRDMAKTILTDIRNGKYTGTEAEAKAKLESLRGENHGA